MTDRLSFTDLDGRTAYDVLGVASNASAKQVKTAYWRLMRSLHPDQGGEDAAAATVTLAYQWLERHREDYDAYLATRRREQADPGPGQPRPAPDDPWASSEYGATASGPREEESLWAREGQVGSGATSAAHDGPLPPPGYTTMTTGGQQASGAPVGSPWAQASGGPRFAPPPPLYQTVFSPPPVPAHTNALAVFSFALSLLCVLGIVAAPLAVVALRQARDRGERGQGYAVAGLVIGIMTTLLQIDQLATLLLKSG